MRGYALQFLGLEFCVALTVAWVAFHLYALIGQSTI